MSKKKQIRLDKDNEYTLVTPQSYESLADFIVKNGEYKFVKDYEYLSKEGVGFRGNRRISDPSQGFPRRRQGLDVGYPVPTLHVLHYAGQG